MPDLSEHFGRVGEFWLGLLGLFLLVMMHPAVRRRTIEACLSFGRGMLDLHSKADSRSHTVHRWTVAFQMIFRDRRDLLIIVAALVVFEYALTLFSAVSQSVFITPLLDTLGWNDPKIQDLYAIQGYGISLTSYAGYSLLGWLAFARGSDESYESAARFRPYFRLLAFAACIIGAGILVGAFNPWLWRSIVSQEPQLGLLSVAGAVAIGGLVSLVGARLFNRPLNGKIAASTISAFVGFIVLTVAIQWLSHLLSLPPPSHQVWLRTLEYYADEFTQIVLLNIVAVGFSVVLANPERDQKTALHNPAKAV